MAEEIVEVNIDGKEVIGSPKTPNKDTNTIVKVVVTGEHVTIPSDLKEKYYLKVNLVTNTIVQVVTGEDVTTPKRRKLKLALEFQLVTTIILNILPDQQDKTVQG